MTNVNNPLTIGIELDEKPSKFALIAQLYHWAHAMEADADELDTLEAMPYEDRPLSWSEVFSRKQEHGERLAAARLALAMTSGMSYDTFLHYSNEGFPSRG